MKEKMNRFEKVEFLQETCAGDIAPDNTNHLFNALVGWLSEDEFDQFYEKFCREWELDSTQEELDKTLRRA